jgi:hypothetical protein
MRRRTDIALLILLSLVIGSPVFITPTPLFVHLMPWHHTWTNTVNADTTCTSGATCGPSVTTVSGNLVVVAASTTVGTTVNSCCGGAGCTWTADESTSTGSGRQIIYHSSNCGVSATVLGPTWVSACGAGPGCHASVYSWSSTGGFNGLDGTAGTGTAFTWATPGSLTSANDVIVAAIVTSGDATGCSGGSTPTCHLDANGNGSGFETNITGSSYSAPAWTGTSGTNNVGTVAYKETSGAASVSGVSKARKLGKLGVI